MTLMSSSLNPIGQLLTFLFPLCCFYNVLENAMTFLMRRKCLNVPELQDHSCLKKLTTKSTKFLIIESVFSSKHWNPPNSFFTFHHSFLISVDRGRDASPEKRRDSAQGRRKKLDPRLRLQEGRRHRDGHSRPNVSVLQNGNVKLHQKG